VSADRERKTAAVPNAAIGADVHQSLDVHRHFGTKAPFDAIVTLDGLTEAVHVGVIEIANAESAFTPVVDRILRAVDRPIPKMYVRPISTFFSRGGQRQQFEP
jgi:hypothetical protein